MKEPQCYVCGDMEYNHALDLWECPHETITAEEWHDWPRLSKINARRSHA